MRQTCPARQNEWAAEIRSRICTVIDFPAAEAIYHHQCYKNFCRGQNVPSLVQPKGSLAKKHKMDRAKSTSKATALQYAFDYLEENDDETITLNDLHMIMKNKSGLLDDDLYGGTLLQSLQWPKGATYGELCHSYIQYVQRHYKKALVVFDGYNSGPTMKYEAHKKRHRNAIGADVDVRKQLVLRMNTPAFLANAKNKQKFIFLLGEELENCPNIQVRHSEGDAEYDIVMSGCTVAMSHPVVVVGDDTDLLILLQHHFIPEEHQAIYLQITTKLVDITALKRGLSSELSHSMLFIHVFTGCDTMFRPYGIGKTSALNKYPLLYEYSNVFLNATQS